MPRRHQALLLVGVVLAMTACMGSVNFSPPPPPPVGKPEKSRNHTRKQLSTGALRQQSGTGKNEPVPSEDCNYTLSTSEKMLMSHLKRAGTKGGDQGWEKVKRLYTSYTGIAIPVFSAAMQAAYLCDRYVEAAEIYVRARATRGAEVNKIFLLHGLKVFGKLKNSATVSDIWEEILERGWMDKFRGGARIDAAAEIGDLHGAVSVLELLQAKNVINEVHYTSAMNACRNSGHNRSHVAAMFLLDDMLQRSLKADVATFGSLVGAHQTAPLQKIKLVLSRMEECRVKPNKVFAEACLSAILRNQCTDVWTLHDLDDKLWNISTARLSVARSMLESVGSEGVRLTKLCRLVDKYLKQRL